MNNNVVEKKLMNKVYQNDTKNQIIILNNLVSMPFSEFSKTTSIEKYTKSLSSTYKKIFLYIYSFKNRPFIKLKRETISRYVGCSIKTVTRATNKFMEDGYINKMQANVYAPNNFSINTNILPTKPVSRPSHVCNVRLVAKKKLSKKNNSLKISDMKKNTHNHVSHTFNHSSYILNIKFKPNITHERAVGPISESLKFRRDRFKIGVEMLKETQKAWISKNKHRITIKDLLERQDVREKLITPTMEKLISSVGFDFRESAKLVAYPDEVLEFALGRAQKELNKKSGVIIVNKKSWLYGVLNSKCKEMSIVPDWNWYRVICDIGGEEAFQHIVSIPDKVEYDNSRYTKAKDSTGKMHIIPRQHRIFEKPAEENIETKIQKLIDEKMKWEEKLLNPEKYFTNSFAAESLIDMAKASIKGIDLKLEKLNSQVH